MSEIIINLNSLEETEKFAKKFSKAIEPGNLVCLFGEIGSGKTTFVQFVARELGVNESVTSPSFVILNEYSTGSYKIYHFDLYRLEKEGVNTIIDELLEHSSDLQAYTFVEWAEFSQGNLLDERLNIYFYYDTEYSDRRIVEVKAYGNKAKGVIERLKAEIAHS